MFAFVSAFPKSLHCTDEAQQAETVLSAVLSIYIYKQGYPIPIASRECLTRSGAKQNNSQ